MAEIDISMTKKGEDLVLMELAGHLDADTFDQLENTMDKLFDNQFYSFIIDLSDLEYISSAGAGVFIGALGTAQENGGDIVFLNPTSEVRDIFDLLGLSEIFTFHERKEEALHYFQN